MSPPSSWYGHLCLPNPTTVQAGVSWAVLISIDFSTASLHTFTLTLFSFLLPTWDFLFSFWCLQVTAEVTDLRHAFLSNVGFSIPRVP